MPYKQTQQTQNFNQTTQTQGQWKQLPQQNQNNQQTQTIEKQPTVELIAKYLYTTPSINKQTGQPMEGINKNGKPWKKLDVIFNKQGSQQNKVFSIFNDLSGKSLRLNQLIPGTDYKLLYEQGIKQVRANKLFWIGTIADTPGKPPYIPNNQATNQTPLPIVVQQNSFKTSVNVLPEHKQLWDSKDFGTLEEWLKIAYDSGLFISEDEAKEVFCILLQQ